MNLCKHYIIQENPNSPENFVKLYGVVQKLDHWTCSKSNEMNGALGHFCAPVG